MMKLVSFDIQSDFAFFRKPETNNTLNVSYNMIHKPAILGILGAILGLRGYEEKGILPEYYEKLSDIKVGIAPLEHQKGSFSKTPIKYTNTVGYANKGTNFLTEELTLIAPKYRIFILLDEQKPEQKTLLERLQIGQSEYIPYLGKNEFTAWWSNFKEWQYREGAPEKNASFASLFKKNQVVKDHSEASSGGWDFFDLDMENVEDAFMYFERLPTGFNLDLMQYHLDELVFTNYQIHNANKMPDVYQLVENETYVQLL
ncbi:type I-B CRISPR-associated protein Cas5b [Riemerella columbina]|uniref:type I-B CRISPR-associated protein Cas5b n=1 Tax=Riemerella columbina TaxID=103810 RepID=UPI00035E49F8|nr:type I-B CRISPR-associated protein Cas5b [Riemerella columbina]